MKLYAFLALALLSLSPSAHARSFWEAFNQLDNRFKKPLSQDLRVVEEGRLYRGPRPANDADIQFLKQLGVRTIINLQGAAQMGQEPGESAADRAAEEASARRAGLAYHARPTATLRKLTQQQQADILAVVEEMADPQLQPVFVHCHGGVDRTGVAVAAFRIIHQGCSFAHAYAELLRKGKFYTPVITAEQVSFLKGLYEAGAGENAEEACPLE